MTHDQEQALIERIMEAYAQQRCGAPLEAMAALTKAAYRDYAEIAVATVREVYHAEQG